MSARAGSPEPGACGAWDAVVVDPVRETPAIAIASALFAEVPHYVTTDAALAFHGLVDQPIRTITVVLSGTRRVIDIGRAVVRPVTVSADRLRAADAYATTADGFAVRLASRGQAVVDAVAEPAWMIHGDLLAEVLAVFADDELERTAVGVLPVLPRRANASGTWSRRPDVNSRSCLRNCGRCAPSARRPETRVAVRTPPAGGCMAETRSREWLERSSQTVTSSLCPTLSSKPTRRCRCERLANFRSVSRLG